ncbi:MAG: NADH-ubiquinone oxidoreductase [Proteobacteria bacterium]|nr:NADH-ubiquinone oxidoreductase [Pseudomonadota bacterium]MBU1060493.1 NADH-ubiquinone oxidoreductase [Pseudomonadota bacterium]
MTPADLHTILHALTLSLVAGTPLFMAALACTPLQKTVARFLPWAALPAFLAAFTAPANVFVEVPWFFMGSRMGLDENGHIFLCLAAFVWFLASFSSRSLLKDDTKRARFLVFFLTAMAGNFGLILASDMLGYYLFFAVMSFAAYGLVIHKETATAAKAGRIYLTLVMIGEVALFTALIILAHNSGSLAIEDLRGISYHPLTLALLFIGFGVKIGALPLHSWMMPAYQAAPIPAAAALGGAMVNAGILGWLRFLPLGQTSCPTEALFFIVAGALAAVYGVLIGLSHNQAGALLGCSSISQMGLITVIFGLGLLSHEAGLAAAPVLIIYVVHHSLAKSSLFFAYDLAHRQGKTLSYLQMTAILLPALALAGLPLTSGAIAKTAFKDLTIGLGPTWYGLGTFFLPITAIGTTILMLHFMHVLKDNGKRSLPERAESRTIFSISFIAVAITLWLWPAARDSASHSLAGAKILQALWPVTAGSILFFVWRQIPFCNKELSTAQEKQPSFATLLPPIMQLLEEKEWQIPPHDNVNTSLHRLSPHLRRLEKIMGRWKIVGLSYLALCLYLVFLLL